MKKIWRLWTRALGAPLKKINEEDKKAIVDRVAIIRTVIVLYALIVDTFILVNIIYNWYK
jgi:hypothetical protein